MDQVFMLCCWFVGYQRFYSKNQSKIHTSAMTTPGYFLFILRRLGIQRGGASTPLSTPMLQTDLLFKIKSFTFRKSKRKLFK